MKTKVRASLQSKVENELSKNATTDDHQLNQILTNVQKQIESVPRLTRSQFLELPKEQRDEYVRVIERLAAQASIAMKAQVIPPPVQNRSSSSSDVTSTINDSSTPFIALSDADPSIVDHRNAHYTIQAIEIAAKREQMRRQQRFTTLRNYIMHRDYSALLLHRNKQRDTYGSFVSVKRLLHRLKFNNIDERSKATAIQWIQKNCLLTRNLFTTDNENDIFDYSTHASVVVNDWLPRVKYAYLVDEFLLYMYLSDDQLYQLYERTSEPCPECVQMRNKLLQVREEVDTYNQKLTDRWLTMKRIDRLRHYIKPDLRDQFEGIIKQGYEIGLDDEKLIQIVLQTSNSNLISDQYPGDLDQTPLRHVPKELSEGIHTYSLQLSKLLNVPESVLVTHIPHDLLSKLHSNHNDKQVMQSIEKMLGRTDIIPEFIEYWKEISTFDPLRWKSQTDSTTSSDHDINNNNSKQKSEHPPVSSAQLTNNNRSQPKPNRKPGTNHRSSKQTSSRL